MSFTPSLVPQAPEARPLAIAKLMLAVAWADGKLAHKDLLRVREYLNQTVRLNDDQLLTLNLYKEYPVDPMERRRLARRFAQRHPSGKDHRAALELVRSILPKASQHCMEKQHAFEEVQEALVEDRINLIKKVKYKLTRTPFPAKISERGRESYLEDYKANPVFFRLKLRVGENFSALRLSPRDAERLGLEMSFVGLVAHADQILLPEELQAINSYLQDKWKLSDEYAELFVTMTLCRESRPSQIKQFCERYSALSNHDERQQLYLFLGKIARMDHGLSEGEQEVLQKIADGLDITKGVRRSVVADIATEDAIAQ